MTDSNHSEIYQRVANEIGNICVGYSQILAAYLHGSFGTDRFRPDSDIDCALLISPGQQLKSEERINLAGRLSASCCHRSVQNQPPVVDSKPAT